MSVFDHMPNQFEGPSAWLARDLYRHENKWRVKLTTTDIAELERATTHYLSFGKDIGEITASEFPLQNFGAHLCELKTKLISGVGVEVITGLDLSGYSREFAAAMFCGIGAHLGTARSQNAAGHILGHVRNTGADPTDPKTRIYQTSARQTFHTDSADVVGLLCLKDAKEGGNSLLVSAESIYNRMHKDCPDLLELLFQPIATDRRGEVPDGAKPFMQIPVLSWHAGKLTVFYQRQYIESAQRFEDAPRLTEAHIKALDAFDACADDPELHIEMRLQPGDMQFVYNHNQLHDRTGFIDRSAPSERRHMLRLWLSVPGDRPLPPSFAERYGSIKIGDRGGIVTRETRLHAALD